MLEQWQSPELNELTAAIVKAQKALKPVAKECTNPFFKSKYADLAAVWPALVAFTDNGIAITQSPMDSATGHVTLDTQLTHISGQWMRSRLTMPLAKDDPQGVGSALTYARRYALGCMTGLVTEEDDDGNLASRPVPTRQQAITQNKQTAQAKINELRKEGTAPSAEGVIVSEGMAGPTPSDVPSPSGYIVKVGFDKGKDLAEVQDLTWLLNYYLNKLQAQHDSRYRDEWEEAILAIEEEKMRRVPA